MATCVCIRLTLSRGALATCSDFEDLSRFPMIVKDFCELSGYPMGVSK